MSLSGQSSQSVVPPMTPSLSDSELSDAAEGQSPRGGPQSPSLRSRSQSLIHLSSTSPRILNPLRKLEKKLLQHEVERANERATVYETMPDSTNATHDPPYLAGQPRSEHINVMGAVGERHAPRPQTVVDVAGDLLAVASDVRVQIGSISTGISALRPLGMDGLLTGVSTAVCFSHNADRLWVGTLDGTLFELDVSQFRAKPTHSPRFPEIGRRCRLVIWHSDDQLGRAVSVRGHSTLLAIPPKPCYARVMHGKLWAAWADADGSAGSTGCLRIYDISGTTAVEHPGGETEWSLSKLGRVTAACAIPLDPYWVFLGHETGHVSVWDTKSGAMLNVNRISAHRITAMVGPSRHLWIGGSTGIIEVIDPFTLRGWVIVKRFEGHHGATSSLRLWSVGEDYKIRFWDGCLRDDWIAKMMDATLDKYCTFSSIKIGILTWNVDGQSPTLLDRTNQQNKEVISRFIEALDGPDMLVFNLQEAIDLSDLTLAARTLLFATREHDVTGRYRHWRKTLCEAVDRLLPGSFLRYRTESKLVGLYQVIWWRGDTGHSIEAIDFASFKTGFDEMYGNKGCLATAVTVDDSSLAFVNAHLAAGANHAAARTFDVARYFDANPVFGAGKGEYTAAFRNGGDGTRLLDMDTVFFAGDLNFRVQLPRQEVLDKLDSSPNAIEELLQHDELTVLKKQDPHFRLRDFEEAKITFPPTYKYDHFTDRYDTSEKQRTPSWCDRILWRTDKEKDVKCLFYRQFDADMSDHKPVGAGYVVRTRKVNSLKRQQAYELALRAWVHTEQRLLTTARSYYPPFAQEPDDRGLLSPL
ncbi:DNase I-like protein [Rhodotorula sp. JG-1b]|nr:DNase I-like protein [Rhodotorula sp. JG-1b]